MEEVDWSKAPEGATHYAVGSAYPWERANSDGSADYWWDGEWLKLSSNYLLDILKNPKQSDRITRAPAAVRAKTAYPKQERYTMGGEDWIDQCAANLTPDEFRGAMKFTIGKYMRRLGRKDSHLSEVTKIADYSNRWMEYEKSMQEGSGDD